MPADHLWHGAIMHRKISDPILMAVCYKDSGSQATPYFNMEKTRGEAYLTGAVQPADELMPMEPLILRHGGSVGWIEVICGSMFSGKTEELIRRLRRAQIARQRVEVFKPRMDRRYSETDVVSHDENALRSTPVDSAEQILLLAGSADVVGIDEAQFFDMTLVDVCQQLANDGKRVIVAGLDQDYMGRPFEPMPQLMAVAEYVTKAACHLRRLRRAGQPLATADRRRRTGRARGGRPLRTPLPSLLSTAPPDLRVVAQSGGSGGDGAPPRASVSATSRARCSAMRKITMTSSR